MHMHNEVILFLTVATETHYLLLTRMAAPVEANRAEKTRR